MFLTVPIKSKNKLCVVLPNALLADSVYVRCKVKDLNERFASLPRSLVRALSRQKAYFTSASGLEPIEAYLFRYFAGVNSENTESPPAWAMLFDDEKQAAIPLANTRWWVTAGSLKVTHNGAEFIPASELNANVNEIDAVWQTVLPMLLEAGWLVIDKLKVGNGIDMNQHRFLEAPQPVPMRQLSPWSLKNVQLTDYLPKGQDCAAWRKLWLEIQAILNNADFNQQRQESGLLPLNCLWFWGGGEPHPLQKGLPKVHLTPTQNYAACFNLFSQFSDIVTRTVGLEQTNLLENGDVFWLAGTDDWVSNKAVFEQLERDVVAPMVAAGVKLHWQLLGSSGWVELPVNWQSRLKFWQSKPNWQKLKEPADDVELSVNALQEAWQSGLEQQELINQQVKL